MRVMTAKKYHDKMEKITGRKHRKSNILMAPNYDTISAKSTKYKGPQAGAFLQRFHNIKTRYDSELV